MNDQRRITEIENASSILEQLQSLTDSEIEMAARRDGITVEAAKAEIETERLQQIGIILGYRHHPSDPVAP